MRTVKTLALAGILAAGIAAAGCESGSGAPSTVHVHGTINFMCHNKAGDQVQITDGSGKLLATPTLGPLKSLGETIDFVFPFSATVPAEPRYGIATGSMTPYYVTESPFEKGIALTC